MNFVVEAKKKKIKARTIYIFWNKVFYYVICCDEQRARGCVWFRARSLFFFFFS